MAGRSATTLMIRLSEKINKKQACWEWTAYLNPDGYGKFRVGKSIRLAHRVVWQLIHGKIPKNMTLDHLCKNRKCVNPQHMEVVTLKENRKRVLKLFCIRNHPLLPMNVWINKKGHRVCKACDRLKREGDLSV